MREIKFRAWDNLNNEMCCAEFSIRCDGMILDGIGQNISDEVEVMQYTGFKDKNGEEIYEGDIIKGDLFDSRLPTMGQIVYDSHFGFFANKNDAGNTALFKIHMHEIIGNIYENPELVEA